MNAAHEGAGPDDVGPARVDLTGPVPPPIGGVAVHMERLASGLRRHGVDVRVHRMQGREPFFAYHAALLRATRGASIVHAHVLGLPTWLLLGLEAATCRRVVLTLHGAGLADTWSRSGAVARAALGAALRRVQAIVAVSDRVAESATRAGVDERRVHVIPAFVPPDRAETQAASPAPGVEAFAAGRWPLLVANAFHLDSYAGAPLYGADVLVDVLARVRDVHPTAGAVLHVAVAPLGAVEALRRRAEARGVADAFLVVPGSAAFGPTLVRGTVMVRPTVADGDAVSIREALHLGVPVVATDVARRPDGALVVPARDVAATTAAVLEAMDRPRAPLPQPDAVPALLRVYRSVLAGARGPLSSRP